MYYSFDFFVIGFVGMYCFIGLRFFFFIIVLSILIFCLRLKFFLKDFLRIFIMGFIL